MLWETPPSSWLLYGLTGKFSVAFFFVLLGYFASKASIFRLSQFVRYCLRRYLLFVFYIFIFTTVFIVGSYGVTWVFHLPHGPVMQVISDGFRYNLIYLLRDSFLFEDNYNATLWCMQQLFIASLICKGFSYLPEHLSIVFRFLCAVISIALLMFINATYFIWICAAILGYILRLCIEYIDCKRINLNSFVLIFLLLLALVFIKLRLPEGTVQYSLQSMAAFLLLLVQFKLPLMQNLLSKAPFPWLGSISIGLFITHTPVYSLLYCSVYQLFLGILPPVAAKLIFFIIAVALSIICSWLLKGAYTTFEKLFVNHKVSV